MEGKISNETDDIFEKKKAGFEVEDNQPGDDDIPMESIENNNEIDFEQTNINQVIVYYLSDWIRLPKRVILEEFQFLLTDLQSSELTGKRLSPQLS
jgi:hypothetical protein